MSRADDLASVFADLRDQSPSFGFRQGTVVTWNLGPGTGTVNVGGTILTDVPFLSAGNLVWFLPGDTVILLKQGASWFILGRVNAPGSQRGVGRNTQVALNALANSSGFGLTTTQTTITTIATAVPAWANVATVNVVHEVLAKNSTAAADFVQAGILMPDGASTSFSSGTVDAGEWGVATHTMNRQVLVTPGGTLTILGQAASTAAAWAAAGAAASSLSAFIVYNSNQGV